MNVFTLWESEDEVDDRIGRKHVGGTASMSLRRKSGESPRTLLSSGAQLVKRKKVIRKFTQ